MSATILSFSTKAGTHRTVPPNAPAPAPAPAFMPRPAVYSIADMARLLSIPGKPRTVISTLRRLAHDAQLPLPRNPRYHGGQLQRGPAAIGARSIWDAGAVEYWLSGPPTGPAAAPATGRPSNSLRGQVSARAAQLRGAM